MITNVRRAFRTLTATPFVTAVAIVSLGLGIGANTAIFSLFNQLILRPLPVVDPERLVNLEAPGPKPGNDTSNVAGPTAAVFSYPMFRDLQRDQTVFTGMVAHRAFGLNVAVRGRTINGEGMQVSGSYFPVLGLVPALGRLLGPEVDEPIGGHPVVVLSHEFWRTQLDADASVVGEPISVNGVAMTIVGVAPDGFRGTSLGIRPLLFVPITMRGVLSPGFNAFDNHRSYWVYVFARLKPDISIAQAGAGLEPLYRSLLAEEGPLQVEMSDQTMAQFLAKPIPVVDGRRGQSLVDEEAGAPLLMLLGVTVIVILIACANIANLLLARGAVRASEMAVRLSIGASRRHLVTQLLSEACVLALAGGLAGLAVARGTLALVGSILPPEALDTVDLVLEPSAIAFAMVVALCTGILFGIFPAAHGTRGALITALKSQTGQPAGARAAARFRNGLVTAQVALSMTLLIVAGLFIRSLANVSRIDLGLDTENVVAFRVSPELSGYEPDARRTFAERLESLLATQPGVVDVTVSVVPILAGSSWGRNVMVEGFDAGPDTNRNVRYNMVGAGYFSTLRIPMLDGRAFTDADTFEAPRVAIVNEAFAEKFGLGRDVVGRRLGQGDLTVELDTEIVGLVKDTRYNEVKRPDPPILYVPYRQVDQLSSISFYARMALPPEVLVRAVPRLVAELDPDMPVVDLKTLPQQVRENVFLDRMIGILSSAFAVLATLLAAVGLYGVLSYTVAQRTREFGLRMALGANAARVRALVLRQVGRMTLIGGLIGIAAAAGLERAARSLLFEVGTADPVVTIVAVAGLATVAVAAGFVPAYRASRVDPMRALRYE